MFEIFAMWGCILEITKDCIDMTNAGSTYFGLIIGAILGRIVSWWIYNRQKKISEKQDNLLSHIMDLSENNQIYFTKVDTS